MTRLILLSRSLLERNLNGRVNLPGVGIGVRYAVRQSQKLSHSSRSQRPLAVPSLRSQGSISQRSASLPKYLSCVPISLGYHGCKSFSSTSQLSAAKRINKTSTGEKKKLWWPPWLLFAAIAAGVIYYDTCYPANKDGKRRNRNLELAVGAPLNRSTFVPFTIISREQVSPTSFIITVKPKYARDSTHKKSWYAALPFDAMRELHSNRSVLEQAWEYGLWAVEFKQPQLQVAREYTPLPSAYDKQEHDLEHGYLRFLIRKMDGGEVSTYLSGLRVGDDVELRGPHLGFDLHERLGVSDKVVFLAGGTGIAPALQVVRALLDRKAETPLQPPSVSIIWANRKRADCEGCDGLSAMLYPPKPAGQQQHKTNAVLSLLGDARARHGANFKYACTVDEEGSFITARAIIDATKYSSSTGGRSSSSNSDTCLFHSPDRLVFTASNDDGENGILKDQAKNNKSPIFENDVIKCQCHLEGNEGGKNLLLVSGPDGFISAFAGPKLWANRKELQGHIRGIVGGEVKKDPKFWRDWLVLKL